MSFPGVPQQPMPVPGESENSEKITLNHLSLKGPESKRVRKKTGNK